MCTPAPTPTHTRARTHLQARGSRRQQKKGLVSWDSPKWLPTPLALRNTNTAVYVPLPPQSLVPHPAIAARHSAPNLGARNPHNVRSVVQWVLAPNTARREEQRVCESGTNRQPQCKQAVTQARRTVPGVGAEERRCEVFYIKPCPYHIHPCRC